MNTCKTCKHWIRTVKHYTRYKYRSNNRTYDKIRDDGYGKPPYWAIVDNIEDLGYVELNIGSCKCEKFIYDSVNDYNFSADSMPNDIIVTDALYYCDGEEWSAEFETGENFGCIHHELEEREES